MTLVISPLSKMSTSVKKLIPVSLDLGNVVVFDVNPFDESKMITSIGGNEAKRAEREAYIESLARENAQLLFNGLYGLPQEESEEIGRQVSLPKPITVLPREKPVPTEKPLTRWEKFAKVKGIQKTKRSAKVYDEASGQWKYRHGSKSAKNDPLADWCEEVKD